jgi:hypothetical protein
VPGHSLGSTRVHLSATATMVAEAPSALVHWWAVMGNLYQYAMRKFSQSGCQSRQGQSLGSAVASWRDGMACGKPSLARGVVSGSLATPGNRSEGLLRKPTGWAPSGACPLDTISAPPSVFGRFGAYRAARSRGPGRLRQLPG